MKQYKTTKGDSSEASVCIFDDFDIIFVFLFKKSSQKITNIIKVEL